MADYKKMYFTLLDEIEKTIERLKQAEQECENIFVLTDAENDEKSDSE